MAQLTKKWKTVFYVLTPKTAYHKGSLELLEGIEPSNLILTKDALCRLSYNSVFNWPSSRRRVLPWQGSALLAELLCVGDPERARTVDLQRDRLAF